jgi:hypothetical protein
VIASNRDVSPAKRSAALDAPAVGERLSGSARKYSPFIQSSFS